MTELYTGLPCIFSINASHKCGPLVYKDIDYPAFYYSDFSYLKTCDVSDAICF